MCFIWRIVNKIRSRNISKLRYRKVDVNVLVKSGQVMQVWLTRDLTLKFKCYLFNQEYAIKCLSLFDKTVLSSRSFTIHRKERWQHISSYSFHFLVRQFYILTLKFYWNIEFYLILKNCEDNLFWNYLRLYF